VTPFPPTADDLIMLTLMSLEIPRYYEDFAAARCE